MQRRVTQSEAPTRSVTSVLHVQRAAGIGGSERHLLTLLPALRERGIDARMLVLATAEGWRFVDALRTQGVPTLGVAMRRHVDAAAVTAIRRTLRFWPPQVVHTHLIHADLHGQLAARLAGVPAVSTIHGTPAPYLSLPGWAAAATAGRLAQRTVAISEHVSRFVRRRGLAPPGRVRTIPYGLDTAPWQVDEAEAETCRKRLGAAADDVLVLIASRLIPYKGHEFLIEGFALAAATRQRLHLLIAGDGPLREDLQIMAEATSVADRITFLGFVDDLQATMGAVDIVAFPTMPGFGEGFGLVNLEAMAAARPVVGTRIDSIPEIVEHGQTGYLVEPGDVDALAHALGRLADDAELRARFGRAGLARAQQEFSLDGMVDAYVALYDEVAGGEA